jgi:hypothetical protein
VSRQLALGLQAPGAERQPRRFHARAHMPLAEQQAGEARAKDQEARVLRFFHAYAPNRATPWDVAEAVGLPITSARRACTNLTKAGLLVHHRTDRRRAGPYGALSATWSAA